MKKFRLIVASFLILCVGVSGIFSFTLASYASYPEGAGSTVDYGSCGNNSGVTWLYDSNDTLYFYFESGNNTNGEISDYYDIDTIPWRNYLCNNTVKAISLGEGITGIGAHCLDLTGCNNVTVKELTIPSSVTKIGANAFKNFTSLQTITFTGKAPTIDSTAFTGCTLTIKYHAGDTTWDGMEKSAYGEKISWDTYGEAAVTENSMSLSGNALTLTPKTGTEISGRVYVAEYDAEGTMTELGSYEAKETVQISAFSSDMAQYCIMWVDGSGAPLADAVTGAINS